MQHFAQGNHGNDPVELIDAPDWIRKLQKMPGREINVNPPKKEEILDVLKKLKKGKAANDVPTIYLKYAIQCESVILELEKLYELVWTTNKIPAKWSHSTLIAIWKGAVKGKASDPKAYRALQVGSTFCKIMVVIILKRLSAWYESQLQEQQQGFRSERGTTDGIFILKRIQQICRKMNRPVYTLFVDLTAAFDHVNRKWMFKSIYQRLSPKTNSKLIELLEALYKYTSTALKQNPKDLFEIFCGVRQSGPESPTLFNLYIDYVMRVYLKECDDNGIRFMKLSYCIPQAASKKSKKSPLGTYSEHTIDWLGYADDLALFFMDERSLRCGIHLLNKVFKRFHLSINVSKTKTMILNYNADPSNYPVTISSLDGVAVDNVKVFRYLGCNICWNEFNTGDVELNLRIDCAESKFYELGDKFFNRKINLCTRVSLLNSLVRSRLTYGCQTWTLTAAQVEKVNSTYTLMLRKMIRNGFRRNNDQWSFVLTNADVLRLCKSQTVEEFVSRQQLKYMAHLIRRDDGSLPKKLLFNHNRNTRPGRSIDWKLNILSRTKCSETNFCRFECHLLWSFQLKLGCWFPGFSALASKL